MTTGFDGYERELWAGRATAYERVFAKLTAHTVEPLLDAAGVTAGTRLLDVGTGPGIVAKAARARDAQVTAVDADPQMAKLAAGNVGGLDVHVAVLPTLPFPDETFDAVVGNFVINHVGEPPVAVSELRRVLRPGGRLALTCWPDPPCPALALVTDAIEQAGVAWPDEVPLAPFRALYANPEAFAALLIEAQLADTLVDEISWDHLVSPEDWWAGPRSGVGSTGAVITRQDAATVTRIKQAYDRLAKPYAADDGLMALPTRALLAHGTR